MLNKKTFCNSRFRWIAISMGIIIACAGDNPYAEAATANPSASISNALISSTSINKEISHEYQR